MILPFRLWHIYRIMEAVAAVKTTTPATSKLIARPDISGSSGVRVGVIASYIERRTQSFPDGFIVEAQIS